jgi:hypothetical protein
MVRQRGLIGKRISGLYLEAQAPAYCLVVVVTSIPLFQMCQEIAFGSPVRMHVRQQRAERAQMAQDQPYFGHPGGTRGFTGEG